MTNENTTHERFNRMVWAFKDDFTGALAKWLVKQSPYPVPDNLEKIIADFHNRIPYDFDSVGMAEVSLANMTESINNVLEGMPDVMALNERKNGRDGFGFSSRYDGASEPDDDFIDIMAVAQNITCEFAERADAECWLRQGDNDDTVTIDLDELSWERIKEAATQSNWMPDEYCADDWVSDVCAFLRDRSVCNADT